MFLFTSDEMLGKSDGTTYVSHYNVNGEVTHGVRVQFKFDESRTRIIGARVYVSGLSGFDVTAGDF